MTNQLFEAALGIKAPWYEQGVDFDTAKRQLTIVVEYFAGSRFAYPGVAGEHPMHDAQTKRLRHLNFFQRECYLEARVPRVRLPDGSVRLVEPDWVGQLDGFTLLFEALVLMLAQQMPFAAVTRIINLSFEGFAAYLSQPHRTPEQITSVSIDMSPAFIKGVGKHLPDARLTFEKFHVVAHASKALDTVRRQQQKADPELKGMRWTLLKDANKLNLAELTDLEALVRRYATKRTAGAWLYREQLREILERKQIHVVSEMLRRCCTNVMRSKVEPMKEVARLVRRHFDGIVAWTQTRQTNGFIEVTNGLFQAAKRKAHGYTRFTTMRTILFLVAGKLNCSGFNPHAS